MVVVSSKLICGARFSDGEVDFLTCAGSLNCPTASGCSWTTHATGGRDSRGCPVIKIKLPEGGRRSSAIPVKSLGSLVKQPKILSVPTLPLADLPYNILPEGWDEALITLKLTAWQWKFVFEIYRGASWLVGLLNVVGLTGAAKDRPSINVPLPRMGKGGYDSDKFENKPAKDLFFSSLFLDGEGL